MYRFKLEKYAGGASRQTCPECGHKRCFVKYTDSEGEITFPDYVGRCNREDKCGYHFTPKQYFERNPQQWEPRDYTLPTPKPVKPTSYIPSEMVGKTLMRHQGHHLFTFLVSKIGYEATDKLMGKYRVTQSNVWEGATLFWQMDIKDRARTGKIMLYDPKTGRRVKHPNHITWAHSKLGKPDYVLNQCFFGEHLLSAKPSQQVAIVESEKSALIAAHYLPSFTWIASGGKSGRFNREALKVLKGRKVILFPDLGATEVWREKLSLFSELGIDAKIYDNLEMEATDEEKREGYDIADFLLSGTSPEEILQKMIEKNPAIQTLIDTLDLELVSVGKLTPDEMSEQMPNQKSKQTTSLKLN